MQGLVRAYEKLAPGSARDIQRGRRKGYFYREPAWIPIPGSGRATSSFLSYMNDSGPCGNEWANQALFDYNGNVLPALWVR